MNQNPLCHHFLRTSAAVVGAGLLQACGTGSASQPAATNDPQKAKPVQLISSFTVHYGDNVLRIVIPSGLAEGINHINIGLTRLYNAGFTVTNQEAGSRRYQRLAGTDAQHIADFRDVAAGRVRTPRVLIGLRGDYGAARILPHINPASLDVRMHKHGTLSFGSSDVYAIQPTLLVKGNVSSFAGPMVYNKFDKPQPNIYAMDSFTRGSTSTGNIVDVPVIQRSDVNAEDTFQGGNLSVLTSLADSPYMSDIQGGVLFTRDVGEQSYHTERVLNTLCLAGVLQKQRAIVFGGFRMGTIHDIYDSSYDSPSVISQIQRTIRVPVLTGFPSGHIVNESIFPLDAHVRVRSSGNSGYSVTFSGCPTLNIATLNLNSLLPPSTAFDNYIPVRNGTTEGVPEQASHLQHKPEAV